MKRIEQTAAAKSAIRQAGMSSNLVNRHPESQILNCQCKNQEAT